MRCSVVVALSLLVAGCTTHAAQHSTVPTPSATPAPLSVAAVKSAVKPRPPSLLASTATQSSSTTSPAGVTSAAVPTTAAAIRATVPPPAVEPGSPPSIMAAVITGARTGAVLMRTCRPGPACTYRVDTTTDDGVTWRTGPTLGGRLSGIHEEQESLGRLVALDPQHLYVYGTDFINDAAWQSVDGGTTWRRLLLPTSGFELSPETRDVLEVSRPTRLGDQDIGRYVVIRPDGTTSLRAQFPVGRGNWVSPMARTVTATIVLEADNRNHAWLMKSFDEALTWSRLPAPECPQQALGGPLAVDGHALFLECYDTQALLRSNDGGVTWHKVGSVPSNFALTLGSDAILWGAGNGAQAPSSTTLVVSRNTGRSWSNVPVGAVGPNTAVFGPAVRGASAWFAAYDQTGTTQRDLLHLTEDAGLHWRTVRIPS